jgi:hypothetical protein
MNQEFGSSVQSEPVVGGAKNRGAIVSVWTLDAHGNAVSGSGRMTPSSEGIARVERAKARRGRLRPRSLGKCGVRAYR